MGTIVLRPFLDVIRKAAIGIQSRRARRRLRQCQELLLQQELLLLQELLGAVAVAVSSGSQQWQPAVAVAVTVTVTVAGTPPARPTVRVPPQQKKRTN